MGEQADASTTGRSGQYIDVNRFLRSALRSQNVPNSNGMIDLQYTKGALVRTYQRKGISSFPRTRGQVSLMRFGS